MTYTACVIPVSLRLTRLSPHAELPRYQTPHAAGLDLHAAIDQPIHLQAGQIVMIPCGFAMAIPEGFEAQVRPRSGLGSRGITLPNSPGTIDADYRGEVRVPLINHGPDTFTIEPRMRIAQMVIAPVARAEIIEVDRLDETARGSGGFGSTGS
jgi:dUTP pyrophosphatase